MEHLSYILHTRPFRETSLLVEALSLEHGRIALVARGAKRGKTKTSCLLQPFIPLNLSWFGNGDLVTLQDAEQVQSGWNLLGKRAICGLYLNELLYKLLHKWDPCASLFAQYELSLQSLAQEGSSAQIILRQFEIVLLRSLGYALQLTTETTTGALVVAEEYYLFDPIHGPSLSTRSNLAAFKGASLLALATDQFTDPQVAPDILPDILLDIKNLMRKVLAYHLGTQQLVTRQLL